MDGYSNWNSYGLNAERGGDERRQEYRQLIHDLSKKLSHENVQSISFLRRSSIDCCAAAGHHYPMAACTAAIAQPPPANHGLQVLEQLWHKGEFSETNLEPLVQLLRDIDRHDLADECWEKGTKLYCDPLHRYRRYGHGEQLNRAVTHNLMPPTPPTLLPSPAGLEYCRDSTDSDDRAQPSSGQQVPGEAPAIEKNKHFSSETEMIQDQHHDISTASKPSGATSVHATPSTGPVDRLSNSRSNSQISRSIPAQSYLNSARSNSMIPLSATAPDVRQLDLEASVSVHFSKVEINRLLQCNPDPELKEKLLTAALTSRQRRDYKDGYSSHREERGVDSNETVPKVIMNSGRQMSSKASNFDSQTNSHLTDKVLLRRQTSLLHVRNIETPIPAPLTPQPQKTHMKLEARSSNTSTGSSDTDSGLSQCHSHRSSTVSNASSSDAFLSEEEDSSSELKEDDHSQTSQAVAASASPQRKDSGVGTAHGRAVSSNDEHSSRHDRLQAKKLERDRRHSAHKAAGPGNSLTKQQQFDSGVGTLRRQSESTRRDKYESRKGHQHISRKRNRAVSLPELAPPNPLAKTGMTIDWRIPRDNFIDPIFHHKNKTFERKCRFSTGSGSSILNVQLAIRLYPNGINWDHGSYSTLIVEIMSTSRPPPPTAYIQFEITGYDCHAGHVITSRQVEYPLKHKEFLIPEFLSHEVIKVSHAKNFEFRATIKIKYLVCSDWVVIPPGPAGL